MTAPSVEQRAHQVLEQAKRFRAAGDPISARRLLVKELERMSFTPTPEIMRCRARLCFLLGEVLEALGKRDEAVKVFQEAVVSDPELRPAGLKLVEYRIDSEEAMSHDMVPHYIDYISMGRSKRIQYGALRRLQHILRIRLVERPADIVWRMEMLGRLHGAAPSINFPKLYLGRGHYLRQDYKKAITALESLSDKTAETNNVLNILGRCHEKQGQLESAQAAYQKSLRLVPHQAGVHFRLGRIELKLAERGPR